MAAQSMGRCDNFVYKTSATRTKSHLKGFPIVYIQGPLSTTNRLKVSHQSNPPPTQTQQIGLRVSPDQPMTISSVMLCSPVLSKRPRTTFYTHQILFNSCTFHIPYMRHNSSDHPLPTQAAQCDDGLHISPQNSAYHCLHCFIIMVYYHDILIKYQLMSIILLLKAYKKQYS